MKCYLNLLKRKNSAIILCPQFCGIQKGTAFPEGYQASPPYPSDTRSVNLLAPELDIYSLAHHLFKILVFYEPRRVTLGNTRHFVEE